MKIIHTTIKDAFIIQPEKYKDNRGYSLETFKKKEFSDILKLDAEFSQEYLSISKHGVLRGMHFQKNNPQGKLLYVSEGEIFDVIVDIRSSSETYGLWFSINLNDNDHSQLWVPPGLAHGFYVLSELAKVHYKLTKYYDPEDEYTLAWDDPTINIKWPDNNPIISGRDEAGLTFKEIKG